MRLKISDPFLVNDECSIYIMKFLGNLTEVSDLHVKMCQKYLRSSTHTHTLLTANKISNLQVTIISCNT